MVNGEIKGLPHIVKCIVLINRMYPSRRFKKDFSSIYGGIHNETHTKTAMKLLEEYEDREDYECSNYKGIEIYKRYLRDFICNDVLTT